MFQSLKEYCLPAIFIILLLAFSFWLQTKSCGSTLTMNHKIWEEKLDMHQRWHPFDFRFLTTGSGQIISSVTGLHFKESFFILQFVLAFILGIAFYHFLRLLDFSPVWANTGLILFFSAYPIMGAHFEPVHTWDDFWLYLFLVLTFIFVIKKRALFSMIFFGLALFAREQAFIYLPIVTAGLIIYDREFLSWKKIALSAFPIIIFLIYFILNYQFSLQYRISHAVFNFENPLRISDSLFSLYISFGFIWVAGGLGLWGDYMDDKTGHKRLLFWGAGYTVIITVLITFLMTRARETRIFFPPFIFLIPLAVIVLRQQFSTMAKLFTNKGKWVLGAAIPILIGTCIFAVKAVVPEFEFRQCAGYCHNWGGINLALIIIIIFLHWKQNRMAAGKSKNQK